MFSVFFSGPSVDPYLPKDDSSGGSTERTSGKAGLKHCHEVQPIPQQETEAAEEDHHGSP